MNRWLREPRFWLIVQPLVLAVWLWTEGRFAPQIVADTPSYEELDWSSLAGVLSGIRPFGYPLFLRLAGLFGAGHLGVPALHFAAHIAAVWIFYWGLHRAQIGKWTSLCAASALFYSHNVMLPTMMSTVFADPLAISLAIAAAGSLILVMADSRSTPGWVGLTLFTFLTYCVQPAYLFVIPLWPFVGGLLHRLVIHRDASRVDWLKFSGSLVAAVLLPFLLFCTVRYFVVGHFGLVSFGGYNVIGVAGQLLDGQTVQNLPTDVRPLARRILEQRALTANWEHPDSFLAIERMFNPMVWDIAVPQARQLYENDPVQMNRKLSRLSLAILAEHPAGYVRWILWNIKHGLIQIAVLLVRDKAVLLCIAALIAIHLTHVIRGPLYSPQHAASADVAFRQSHLVLWLALGFAAGKLLLVVLVEPANDRYMTGAMVFLPAAVACVVCVRLSRYVGAEERPSP